jgi:hypothetical protein
VIHRWLSTSVTLQSLFIDVNGYKAIEWATSLLGKIIYWGSSFSLLKAETGSAL